MNSSKRRVVITGADHPTALGTARALRGLDVEIIGLCVRQHDSCCRSRVWDRIVEVENDPEAYLLNCLYQVYKYKMSF